MKAEIVERLKADYGFRVQGDYLLSGRCPQCRKPDLFGRVGEPWVITCNHRNKCGYQAKSKELYPDIWENLPKKYQPTREDPHRTARMFLHTRGLNPDQADVLWEQATWTDSKGTFQDHRLDTICFPFAGTDKDGKAITIKNHRIIAPPKGCDKTRTFPGYKGNVWQPNTLPAVGDLWVVEGVMEALSLMAVGKAAVSPLSAGHVPDRWLDSIKGQSRRLIIAYNNDEAGHRGASKMGEACKERGLLYDYAFSPFGKDWNDQLLSSDLTGDKAAETFSMAMWRGELHKAPDAATYYGILAKHAKPMVFEWDGAIYRVGKDEGEGTSVRRILGCVLRPVYFQSKRMPGGRLEYSARMEVISPARGKPTQITLDAKALSDHRAFKQTLTAGALEVWTGAQPELDSLVETLKRKRTIIVEELNVVGYDEQSDTYFFPDCAYDPKGRAIAPEGGSFKIGQELFTLNVSDAEKAFPLVPGLDMADLLRQLLVAFGEKGIAVAGFAAASLFAQQFAARPGIGFFPFLSLYGQHGTGKSSITKMINLWMGRNVKEGLSVSSVHSAKAGTRKIAALSNLPLAITELNAEKAKRFDLDRLLDLFNRNALGSRANKTHDNSITELDFLGTLMFAQNHEPFSNGPMRSRFVSLAFDTPLTGKPLDTNKALLSQPAGRMTAFRHGILMRREEFQAALFEAYDRYRGIMDKENIGDARVMDTHSTLMAGAHAVLKHFLAREEAERITLDVYAYLVETAKKQVKSLAAESDYLGLWLEAVRDQMAKGTIRDHNPKHTGDVWLQMSNVMEALEASHQRFSWTQLFEELKTSPKVKFHNESRYSAPLGRSVRVYGITREALGMPDDTSKPVNL